jgi:hypothetical protein
MGYSDSGVSRRQFLARFGFLAAGFGGLKQFVESGAWAAAEGLAATATGYGPLVSDSAGLFDLPQGFEYRVISGFEQVMDDGLLVPSASDGMCAFPGDGGRVILVRNHELTPDEPSLGPFGPGNQLLNQYAEREKLYDQGTGRWPGLGGTSTVIYNPASGKTERQFMSLLGTDRNCAGGPTPWGSWISCEEVDGPMRKRGRLHGYNFEVPSQATAAVDPLPLEAMGRFRHEAVAIDPATGIVYQTEDVSDGLIYRFLPNNRRNLHKGGRLQALVLPELDAPDTRNWSISKARVPIGKPLAVEWLDLEGVDNPDDDLRFRGNAKGAAYFARAEGMWYGNGTVWFACTTGGPPPHLGQIWKLTPSSNGRDDRLTLFTQPGDNAMLQNGDNLTVAPWGDVVVCEDFVTPGTQHPSLVGITPAGEHYSLGRNAYNGSELAGACFSPDARILFVNIMYPGLTLAITGPWRAG